MRLTTKKHGEVLSIPEPSGKCNTELGEHHINCVFGDMRECPRGPDGTKSLDPYDRDSLLTCTQAGNPNGRALIWLSQATYDSLKTEIVARTLES